MGITQGVKIMNDEAQKLLMMFIRDSYKNQSGKPSRGTSLKLMKFVRDNPELSQLIGNSDWNGVLNHKVES
jgi:hypothetical protein